MRTLPAYHWSTPPCEGEGWRKAEGEGEGEGWVGVRVRERERVRVTERVRAVVLVQAVVAQSPGLRGGRGRGGER